MGGKGRIMAERNSQRKYKRTVLFVVAVVLVGIGAVWCGFSLRGPALAEESAKPAKVAPPAQRLPGDLVEVADAQYASLDGLAAGSREAQERQRQAAKRQRLPLEVKTCKTGLVLRLIPAGTFTMGSPSSEKGHGRYEAQQEVTLTTAFYCGKFEVTQGQWECVMGSNPSRFKNAGQEAPVDQVSWEDCQAFLTKLCQMEGVPEGTYRLLTEAEWEYACRAGTQTAFCRGDHLALHMANLWGDAPMRVGKFEPNAWGLHDMHGNVSEWCADWLAYHGTDAGRPPQRARAYHHRGLSPGQDNTLFCAIGSGRTRVRFRFGQRPVPTNGTVTQAAGGQLSRP